MASCEAAILKERGKVFKKAKKGGAASVKDPVCGMMIDPGRAAGKETHEGKDFYFCSKACHDAFRADAHRYGH